MQPKRAPPHRRQFRHAGQFWFATSREAFRTELFKRVQLLSELEPQYAGQTAEAHGVRDDDNDVCLRTP
jgi:hypothetical protein